MFECEMESTAESEEIQTESEQNEDETVELPSTVIEYFRVLL